MKKILIVLLLMVFTLFGCSTGVNQILGSLNDDIDVCDKTCETSFQSFSNYSMNYYDSIEIFQLSLAENKNSDFDILKSGETIDRDDISRLDPVTDNYELPMFLPYAVILSFVHEMNTVVGNCDLGGMCDGALDSSWTNISNVDFGFDDNGGYYYYEILDGNEIKRVFDIKFEISDEEIRYETLIFDISDGTYEYTYFDNQIYREYYYENEDDFHFIYINLLDKSYINYELSGGVDNSYYFDSETKMLYKSIQDSWVSVSYYDGMEFVAYLLHNSDEYQYRISFHYMDGWDTLEFYTYTPTAYSHLFNGEVEVYTDYQIRALRQGLRYYTIDATIIVSEDEIDQYTLPDSFTGNVTEAQLVQALEDFENFDHPLNIAGLNPADVLDKCIKRYDELTKKYID